MTSAIRLPSRRPAFRRWTTGLLVVLFIVGLNGLWDYREARRVSSTLDRLRSAGARTSTRTPNAPAMVGGPTQDAGPLFVAAAILARARTASIDSVAKTLDAAIAGGSGADDVLERAGTLVADGRDSLDLLDRAAAMSFNGFAPGTAYVSRWWQLGNLYRFAGLRTQFESLTGKSPEAAKSLVAELTLIRATSGVFGDSVLPSRFVTAEHAALVLSRTSPTDADLLAIAKGLREADDDGVLARQLDGRRARSIEMFLARARYGSAFSWEWLVRPFAARTFLANLDRFGEKVAVAGGPWPDRLNVSVGTATGPARWFSGWIGEPAGLSDETLRVIGGDLAGIRAAQLLVAIERYRRAHEDNYPTAVEQLSPDFIDALPVDPYSGRPMRFQSTATEVVVYSVGPDRADNTGDIRGAGASGFTGTSRQGQVPAGDVGLRVTKKTGR